MMASKIDLNYQNAYGYLKGFLKTTIFNELHTKSKLKDFSSIDPSCRIIMYLGDSTSSIAYTPQQHSKYIELSKTQCFDLMPASVQKFHAFSNNFVKGGLEVYIDEEVHNYSFTLTIVIDEQSFKNDIGNAALKTDAAESGFLQSFQNNQYTFDVKRPITDYTGVIRPTTYDPKTLGPSFTYLLNESGIREIIKNIPEIFASVYVKDFIQTPAYKNLIANVPNLYTTPTFDDYMNKLIFNDPSTLDEFDVFFEKYKDYHDRSLAEKLTLSLVPTKYIQALTGRTLMNNTSSYSLVDILASSMPTSYIISRYTPSFNLNRVNIEMH